VPPATIRFVHTVHRPYDDYGKNDTGTNPTNSAPLCLGKLRTP